MNANNTPAAFTDGDLDKLRYIAPFLSDTEPTVLRNSEIFALLSRLEAAERAALACQSDFCCNTQEFKTWRKVAGKEK